MLEFKHGDILDMNFKDWRDGDVVFANSTCFDDNLMNKIAALSGKEYLFVIIIEVVMFD